MTLIGILIALSSLLCPLAIWPGDSSAHWVPTICAVSASIAAATLGALLASRSPSEFLAVVRALRESPVDSQPAAEVRELARTAARAGLHSLRHELEYIGNPFVRRAAELIAAGAPHREIRELLTIESERALRSRKEALSVLSAGASSAPALGIVSSLLLLMTLLQQGQTQTLLQQMSLCFLPTATGMILAHVALIPLAGKLAHDADREEKRYECLISALVAIRAEEPASLVISRLDAVFGPDGPPADGPSSVESDQVLARPIGRAPRLQTPSHGPRGHASGAMR